MVTVGALGGGNSALGGHGIWTFHRIELVNPWIASLNRGGAVQQNLCAMGWADDHSHPREWFVKNKGEKQARDLGQERCGGFHRLVDSGSALLTLHIRTRIMAKLASYGLNAAVFSLEF